MNFLQSVHVFLGDSAAVLLAFTLGVLFVQPVQNLIAAVTALTARLAARLSAKSAAGTPVAKA